MPLVINSLRGGHTDRQTHTHTDVQTKAISRNQVRTTFGHAPEGIKDLNKRNS